MNLRLLLVFLLAAIPLAAVAQPIDRQALVSRHNITLSAVDPHAPLMIGNGDLGFTADITGLQTFPEQYSDLAPLLTMAQWAWHSFPNPNGYTEASSLRSVAVKGRGELPFAWMNQGLEAKSNPADAWLRENPHRFSLGRVALAIKDKAGRPAKFSDLSDTLQSLDLWTGVLTSRFSYDGEPVLVQTRVASGRDTVLVAVSSRLVGQGRLGISVRYPGVAAKLNPDPSDWANPDLHTTVIKAVAPGRVTLSRRLDGTTYGSTIQAGGATVMRSGAHAFDINARSGDRLEAAIDFDRSGGFGPLPTYDRATAAADAHWRDYWTRGGVIDFSGSTDPRAAELERRVVLSQYLMAVNGAGEVPPQEEGLFSNSWNGKFHLEMHPWHAAHFAIWGRPERLERSLGWYVSHLPRARAEARRRQVQGAWWPKMSGPEGRNSPSSISPFIMWQQPHPILMAELAFRAHPDRATLDRYGSLVEESAKLLASWPLWDETGDRFVLGPPIIPVQENHDPMATLNPAFELEYFRQGLVTAQAWRVRRGLARDAGWDRVIAKLAPMARRDGLYLAVENDPDLWAKSASDQCRGNALEDCPNRDHPSFLMSYGLIGSDRVDQETMRATLRAVERDWDLRQTWGWDYPMVAMTAARLGEPEAAVDWLFNPQKNNQWGVSGMTPRVHLEHFLSPSQYTGEGGSDGPGYRRAAETYFPSNGSLLLAVGMMAGGWDGSRGHAPGFPREGWVVRSEGLRPLP